MGLLDDFASYAKTPEGQGLLSMVAGGLAGAQRGAPLNSLGRAGLAGLMGYSNAQERQSQQAQEKQMQDYRQMQMDDTRRKLDEQQTQRSRLDAWIAQQNPRSQVLSQGGGPTLDNLHKLNSITPQQRQTYDALQAGVLTPGDYLSKTNPGPDYATLKPGEVLIDRRNPSKPLFSLPEPIDPNKPFTVRDGQIVANPAFQQFELEKASRGAARTSVTNVNSQESEQSKTYGKGIGEARLAIQNSAFTAPGQLTKLQRLEELLSGVDGGKMAPTGMAIASLANSLGYKIDSKLGAKEAAQALAVEMANGMRQPGTGVMTDKDFENFLQTVPDLSKSAEGRKQITATLRAKLNRDIALGKKARDYAKTRNGVIDDGFFDQVSQFMADNPVVSGAGNTPAMDQADLILRGGKQ